MISCRIHYKGGILNPVSLINAGRDIEMPIIPPMQP